MRADSSEVSGSYIANHLSTIWHEERIKDLHVLDSINVYNKTTASDGGNTAVFSRVFSFPETGDVLVRVLSDRTSVELFALQRHTDPIRIRFAERILSWPELFMWQSIQLRLIVVTESALLIRLAFAADDLIWQSVSKLGRWYQPYRIHGWGITINVIICYNGNNGVIIGTENGGLLVVEVLQYGDAIQADGLTPRCSERGTELIETFNR
jgi:hypothetical protein